MNEPRVFARWCCVVLAVLGITSGIGAILNGNDPTMSFSMSCVAFIMFAVTLGN